MDPRFLSVLSVLLVVSGSYAAHLVTFKGDRTLPQEVRDIQAQAERECDAACVERRLQKLYPMERHFLSSPNENFAGSHEETRGARIEIAARSITGMLEEAKRKRALDLFERGIMSLKEVERGVVKGGLHGTREHPVTRAAELVRRTVEQKVDRNQKAADMVRQVRALINELEARSQTQTKQAEFLGRRAVQDLNAAMALETRAAHVREAFEHNQQERALHKVHAIKRSATMMADTQEEVKRGMRAVKDMTEQLQEEEAAKREVRRRELFGELRHLASRALQGKVNMLTSREMEDEEKRELTGMKIAQGFANSKRAIEEHKSEEARELAGLKIANDLAKSKRALEEVKLQKARELTGIKIADQVAQIKRSFEKRRFEEEHEAMGREVAAEVASAKRALEEQKNEEARAFTGMKVAAQMAEAKRHLQKREFEKDRELTGMKVASEIAEARREVDKRKLQERELAEARFSQKLEALKRALDELKVRKALNTMDTYRRALGEGEQHEMARRALEGLKTAVEKHATKRDEELKELEALLTEEGIEATEHKVTA